MSWSEIGCLLVVIAIGITVALVTSAPFWLAVIAAALTCGGGA